MLGGLEIHTCLQEHSLFWLKTVLFLFLLYLEGIRKQLKKPLLRRKEVWVFVFWAIRTGQLQAMQAEQISYTQCCCDGWFGEYQTRCRVSYSKLGLGGVFAFDSLLLPFPGVNEREENQAPCPQRRVESLVHSWAQGVSHTLDCAPLCP